MASDSAGLWTGTFRGRHSPHSGQARSDVPTGLWTGTLDSHDGTLAGHIRTWATLWTGAFRPPWTGRFRRPWRATLRDLGQSHFPTLRDLGQSHFPTHFPTLRDFGQSHLPTWTVTSPDAADPQQPRRAGHEASGAEQEEQPLRRQRARRLDLRDAAEPDELVPTARRGPSDLHPAALGEPSRERRGPGEAHGVAAGPVEATRRGAGACGGGWWGWLSGHGFWTVTSPVTSPDVDSHISPTRDFGPSHLPTWTVTSPVTSPDVDSHISRRGQARSDVHGERLCGILDSHISRRWTVTSPDVDSHISRRGGDINS
jgi:hypothetical protein